MENGGREEEKGCARSRQLVSGMPRECVRDRNVKGA